MKKILVMGSGNGSNFEAIVNHLYPYDVEVHLFCDKPEATIIERAKRLGVVYHTLSKVSGATKEDVFNTIRDLIQAHEYHLIALAGFMLILPPDIVSTNKVVNVHPSLLPAFPGLHSIKQAHDYGVKFTGVTVHLVDAGMDTGRILDQEVIPINPKETLAQLEERVHKVEHRIFPQNILNLLLYA